MLNIDSYTIFSGIVMFLKYFPANLSYVAEHRKSPNLPPLVFCPVNDVQLLFSCKVNKIDCEAGDPDHQVAVFFRFLHGFAQDFAGDDIKLDLIDAFFFNRAEEGHQVSNVPFVCDKLWAQSKIKRAAERKAVRRQLTC